MGHKLLMLARKREPDFFTYGQMMTDGGWCTSWCNKFAFVCSDQTGLPFICAV